MFLETVPINWWSLLHLTMVYCRRANVYLTIGCVGHLYATIPLKVQGVGRVEACVTSISIGSDGVTAKRKDFDCFFTLL